MSRRRVLAPEVIQTSAMDCGPASLKSILEGFGVHVSYGRLREACQTDVDGTSIDVMEDVAAQLGLDACQTMVPLDHLLIEGRETLPAILVVRNPDGDVHFVVAWRRVGPLVQVMDPASGRHWLRSHDLLARTFEHTMEVAADAWRHWAGTEEFRGPLRTRLRRLGARMAGDALLSAACADPSWRSLATLDAATRLTEALARAGGIDAGPEAGRLLVEVVERAQRELEEGETDCCIPRLFWSAAPAPPSDTGEARVLLRGAVLVRVRGKATRDEARQGAAAPLSPELAAALREPPTRPLREILRILREDGLFTPAIVAFAALAAAAGGVLEALILRGLIGAALHLGTWPQRALAMLSVAMFFALCLGLEFSIVAQTVRIGRRLEIRLRQAFFAKLPRIHDRYFSSRPTSDMSHRAHAIQILRQLPQLGVRILRVGAQLLICAVGLVWIDPPSTPYVLTAAGLCLVVPWVAHRALTERDRRLRAFDGALSRFYLDALLGLVPVRTHGAGPTIRREHESMLGELRRAFLGVLSVSTTVDAVVTLVNAGIAIVLLGQYLARGGNPAGSLLFVYWALALAASGGDLARALRQYPEQRNTTERLVEPLGALEDEHAGEPGRTPSVTPNRPPDILFVGVEVRAAGKVILEDVSVHIPAGAHVAVVGLSGAGKSTLCGLLLGWHRASRGEVLVNREPLRGGSIEALRRHTAWVDPGVQLWNRSVLENVAYGSKDPAADFSPALEAADVVALLEQLPDGLQTRLGDGGALVSGGEGQRVRLARAMLRPESRLVILDEPFRGLDRERRRELLRRARDLWRGATLLCVTHDVCETLDFERVLVVDERRVIEDGSPGKLAAAPDSRYHALLETERGVREHLWRNQSWRRVELRAGVVVERKDDAFR